MVDIQGDRPAGASTTTTNSAEVNQASQARRHRHSADREKGRGRTVHRGDEIPTNPVYLPRSPSPVMSNKHRRLDEQKGRDKRGSYAMQYRKYQQQSCQRTGLPTRLDNKEPMQPSTDVSCCHQLLTDMEPALIDEQPLTEVDHLPPISDSDPYFDSLEEYEVSCDEDQKTSTDVEHQAAEDSNHEQSAIEAEASSADVFLLPQIPGDVDPVAEGIPAKENKKSEKPITDVVAEKDIGSVADELSVVPGPHESASEKREDEQVLSVHSFEEDHSPDVIVKDTYSHQSEYEVLLEVAVIVVVVVAVAVVVAVVVNQI